MMVIRAAKNIAGDKAGYQRNLPLWEEVLDEEETILCGADCRALKGSGKQPLGR
jgi:hypothetical protein